MNGTASILIGLALVIGVGGFVYWQNRDMPAGPAAGENHELQESGLTAAAVAMHMDATSCWSIINDDVYDLTAWIPKHPGGPDAILKLCGVDGSERFNGQHGGQALQAHALAGFKLGALEE